MKPDEAILLEACLIRRVEETLLRLFSEGKLEGTTHTCIGQELAAVVLGDSLADHDIVISNHRCHGHYIAVTSDVERLIAEIMGRETGVCRGFGGSQHLFAGRFFTNGVQGGMTPVGTGVALANKRRGTGAVTVVCIGDGTLGEGVLYEAMNLASKWELPVLFWLENNGYAQSTCSDETLAGRILSRPEAFGIATYHGSTDEWQALRSTAREAVDFVRSTRRPAFVQVDTSRLMAHSKGDDNRDPALLAALAAGDPLTRYLAACADTPRVAARLAAQAERVAAAEAAAEAAGHAVVSDRTLPPLKGVGPAGPCLDLRQGQAINEALRDALARNPCIILLGEDVRDSYGGAFKVTRTLSTAFPDRVLNTPISEAGIVGIGSGLALAGMRPVVELMFGDFIMLALDQLVNHAAKFHAMYDGQTYCPLVVRTPMGGGRGYGATHSQSLEKYLAGVPGLRVFMLHHRLCARDFYTNLLNENTHPAVVCEHKLLYPVSPAAPLPDAYELARGGTSFLAALVRPAGQSPDVTVVAFGHMGVLAEQAIAALSRDEEIDVDLVLPVCLWPLDCEAIEASVRKTGRLVVVEEGSQGFDLGAEIIARLVERGAAPRCAKRVGARSMAIPSAKALEAQVLPGVSDIRQAVMEVYNV